MKRSRFDDVVPQTDTPLSQEQEETQQKAEEPVNENVQKELSKPRETDGPEISLSDEERAELRAVVNELSSAACDDDRALALVSRTRSMLRRARGLGLHDAKRNETRWAAHMHTLNGSDSRAVSPFAATRLVIPDYAVYTSVLHSVYSEDDNALAAFLFSQCDLLDELRDVLAFARRGLSLCEREGEFLSLSRRLCALFVARTVREIVAQREAHSEDNAKPFVRVMQPVESLSLPLSLSAERREKEKEKETLTGGEALSVFVSPSLSLSASQSVPVSPCESVSVSLAELVDFAVFSAEDVVLSAAALRCAVKVEPLGEDDDMVAAQDALLRALCAVAASSATAENAQAAPPQPAAASSTALTEQRVVAGAVMDLFSLRVACVVSGGTASVTESASEKKQEERPRVLVSRPFLDTERFVLWTLFACAAHNEMLSEVDLTNVLELDDLYRILRRRPLGFM